MKKINIQNLNKGKSKNIKIGELNQKVITTLHLDLKPQDINIWSIRIDEHCEKHKSEYSTPQAYYQAIESIPDIIANPDYIGLHKNGNIMYIKKLDDISVLGVKVVNGNNGLLFRTIFPITNGKLQNYIKTKKVFPYN